MPRHCYSHSQGWQSLVFAYSFGYFIRWRNIDVDGCPWHKWIKSLCWKSVSCFLITYILKICWGPVKKCCSVAVTLFARWMSGSRPSRPARAVPCMIPASTMSCTHWKGCLSHWAASCHWFCHGLPQSKAATTWGSWQRKTWRISARKWRSWPKLAKDRDQTANLVPSRSNRLNDNASAGTSLEDTLKSAAVVALRSVLSRVAWLKAVHVSFFHLWRNMQKHQWRSPTSGVSFFFFWFCHVLPQPKWCRTW